MSSTEQRTPPGLISESKRVDSSPATGSSGAGAGVLRVESRLEQPLVGDDRVDVGEVPLDGRHLRRRPDHAGRPPRRVLEVEPHQVVVGELRAGGQRVGVGAGRDQPLVDAGVGVGDGVLRDRAARASGTDRVAQLAVPLDEPLLGHQQRLGLHRDVAVVAGVGERGRDHRVPLPERGDVAGRHARHRLEGAGVVLQRRAARRVRRAAVAAVGDEQLVVPLLLRPPRLPRLAGLPEREDGVAVAVLEAVLAAHDERHLDALVGRRGGDVGRRVLPVVGLEVGLQRVGRLVEERVAGRLVAERVDRGLLAPVVVELRPAEDRSAVRVVHDPRRGRVARGGRAQPVAALVQALHQSDEAAVGALGEPPGHVAAVEPDGHLARGDAARQPDLHQRVTARDQVSAVGEHLDDQAARAALGRRRPGRGGRRHGQRYGEQAGQQAEQEQQRAQGHVVTTT